MLLLENLYCFIFTVVVGGAISFSVASFIMGQVKRRR